MSLPAAALNTVATQWMERTLDDSAVRRIYLPEALLTADAICILLQNITEGLVVYPNVINKHLAAELPFMASENILMAFVKAGGNRQDGHERIRVLAQAAGNRVKQEGADNDLLERIRADDMFSCVADKLEDIMNPSDYIGRAPEQVDVFIEHELMPVLGKYATDRGKAELSV